MGCGSNARQDRDSEGEGVDDRDACSELGGRWEDEWLAEPALLCGSVRRCWEARRVSSWWPGGLSQVKSENGRGSGVPFPRMGRYGR